MFRIVIASLLVSGSLSTPVSRADLSFECGNTPIPPNLEKNIHEYIVGGEVARPYSWPWQVEYLVRDDPTSDFSFDCGGTLISHDWVMTAAHCVIGRSPSDIQIRLGNFQYNSKTEPGEDVMSVSEAHVHPQYQNPLADSHDVAILKLSKPVAFTFHIQPVCIPKSVTNVVLEGKQAYVTGWGTTQPGGDVSVNLKQVMVPFLNQAHCEKEYPGSIDNTMECAGKVGRDSCQGDSGGPLVTKHSVNGKWYQAGIVSWGRSCAKQGYAGVYARTSAMCPFLEHHIGAGICRD